MNDKLHRKHSLAKLSSSLVLSSWMLCWIGVVFCSFLLLFLLSFVVRGVWVKQLRILVWFFFFFFFCYFLTLKHEKANVAQTKSKNDNNKDQKNRKDHLPAGVWVGPRGARPLRQTDPNSK